jgi:hypothetical protein
MNDRTPRVRRNAWLLAVIAVGIYVGMILWYVTGGAS